MSESPTSAIHRNQNAQSTMLVLAALLLFAGSITADSVSQPAATQTTPPAPTPASGDPRGSLTQPRPRTDPNSEMAHRQLIEKATKGRIDIYFIGDSITRRWGATDSPEFLANWKQLTHRLEPLLLPNRIR